MPTLEEQQREYAERKVLAMPLAGLIAWLITGVCGYIFQDNVFAASMSLFAATGSIFLLALGLQVITGEDILGGKRQKNTFDSHFIGAVLQSWIIYAIAIPFFMIERSSLPLSVGILTGTMWIQYSGLVKHWVGYAHVAVRTTLIVALWYLMPDQRFSAIPFAIVVVYIGTILVLSNNHRNVGEV